MTEPPTEPATGGGPDRLHGAEAAKAHLTFGAAIVLCIAAFWFELTRALGGNSLSWAYVFEWPLFAVFAGYMWWTVLHGTRRQRKPAPPAKVAPEHAEMLKAWQAHLKTMADEEAGKAPPSPGTRH